MGKIQKVWKSGGDEDKFLKTQIKKGKITKNTKPADVKALHPDIFGDFTLDVFRNHYNTVKRAEGLFLDGDNNLNALFDDGGRSDEVIPTSSSHDHVEHENFPVIVEQFKDPETEINAVLVSVCLPSGATNVKIDVNDDGTAVIVKYKWPALMYKVEKLFKKDLNAVNGKLEKYHPKITAYKSGLEKTRSNIDVAPESSIRIKLPFPVQTSTWTKKGVKDENGTMVLRVELKGHSTVYSKKPSDLDVEFEL